MALGVFLGALFATGHNFPNAWRQLANSGVFTWGVGFLLFFRILIRSVDRIGKRKLARQVGLLPNGPRS